MAERDTSRPYLTTIYLRYRPTPEGCEAKAEFVEALQLLDMVDT